MAYEYGMYGIRHRPAAPNEDTRRLWRVFLVLAVLSVITLVIRKGCVNRAKEKVTDIITGPAVAAVANTTSVDAPLDGRAHEEEAEGNPAATKSASPKEVEAVKSPAVPSAKAKVSERKKDSDAVKPKVRPAVVQARRWLMAADSRTQGEKVLLEKLVKAETDGNLVVACDTISKLRARPSMQDIDDPLARRLGTMNKERVLGNGRTDWTSEVTVRRGDSVARIAREHGTTSAAILKMNRISDPKRLALGMKLKVLEFPKATLVIHKRTSIADLFLKGKFFCRYYVKVDAKAKPGARPISNERPVRTVLKDIGVSMAASDRDELEMFLSVNSSITVADP